MNQPASVNSNSTLARGTAARRMLVVIGGVLAAGIGAALLARPSDRPLLRPLDFCEYWAAGRLNFHGENPYDPELLYPLQRGAGWEDEEVAVMMWNPPWTLTLVMPLGILPSRTAQVVWLLLHLAIVALCARVIWKLYDGPDRQAWIAWAVAIVFAPTVFFLMCGQITGFLLLGLTGFLWGVRHDRTWVAGASAALLAIKPHLGLLFALALALESLRSRQMFHVAVRGAIVLAIGTVIPLIFNPDVWSQYREATSRSSSSYHTAMRDFVQPTLGYQIRLLVPGTPFWAQFIPLGLALAALSFYWWLRRHRWDWLEELPRITLIAALTACYGGWAFDLVILLVPVLQATVWLIRLERPKLAMGLAAAYVAANAVLIWSVRVEGSQTNPWITPAVLGGYALIAGLRARSSMIPASEAIVPCTAR
jgi:hypothetical protein